MENVFIVLDTQTLEETQSVISETALAAKALATAGYRRTKAQAPAFRICGPLRKRPVV